MPRALSHEMCVGKILLDGQNHVNYVSDYDKDCNVSKCIFFEFCMQLS